VVFLRDGALTTELHFDQTISHQDRLHQIIQQMQALEEEPASQS